MAYVKVWDRLLQKSTSDVETPVQPGRYRVAAADNSLQVVPLLDGSAELPGRHAEAWQPAEGDLLELNARAIEMLAEGAPEASARPVLALGLQPAEEDDAAIIGFLDAHDAFRRVMNDPAELLERHDELTGMGHGGRITPRTIRRLASHADDWRTRRSRIVEPRRLLVERLNPQLDRPENRLVINTLVLLKKRLDLLAQDARGQSILNDSDGLRRLNFRAQQRTTLLWSHTISETSAEDLAMSLQRRRDDLDDALISIDNLSDSPLGQTLAPWRERSAEGAFGSNLLRDHESYSKIGRLWRQLSANAGLDLSARRAIAVAREERFDEYVMACVRHAVDSGAAARKHQKGLTAQPTVSRNEDGTIQVITVALTGDVHSVRVVPQFIGFSDLQRGSSALALDAQSVIVVSAAEPDERDLLRLGVGNAPTVVGLGPYVLTGVEALGSALRWHLEARELLQYPRMLRLPRSLAAATTQFRESGLVLRKEPSNQLAIVSVDTDNDFAEQARALLAFGDRTQQLDPAIDELRNAVVWTRILRHCLACGSEARSFLPDGDRFMAQCSESACGASWGVDLCPVGHRRPLLRFPNNDQDRGMDRWALGDEDPCPGCLSGTEG